jgi:hypothetical protein
MGWDGDMQVHNKNNNKQTNKQTQKTPAIS